MSVAEGEGGYPRSQVWEVGLPYHMTYSVMHVMLPTPPPPRPGQTHAYENITFRQRLLRAIMKSKDYFVK